MKAAVAAVALSAICGTNAFVPASNFMGGQLQVAPQATSAVSMSAGDDFKKALTAGALAVFAGLALGTPEANAISRDKLESLSYLQIKGTGLANRCPEVTGEGSITINGKKKIVDLCIEPKQFQVLEETENKRGERKSEYVNTKLMTRQTYTLYGIEGDLSVEGGKVTFKEQDGIDYAATTVQLPGGERVPFLFTVKELVAKATTDGNAIQPGFQFGGSFKTPSYRTGLFLDPKGRGGFTGYDMAVALPGLQSGEEGDKELFKENNKVFDVTGGNIEFQVSRVDADAGEIGGVFVSKQKGDTDMGSKAPKDLLIKGIFYGRIAGDA
jgi:photosystem II oxygen-evolving enhancer protein 1